MTGRLLAVPDWIWDLPRGEAAALRALARAYPGFARDGAILAAIPRHRRGGEVTGSFLPVVIHRLRHRLPEGGIERVRNLGFRLTPAAAALL